MNELECASVRLDLVGDENMRASVFPKMKSARMFSHQDDVSIAKAMVFEAHPFSSAIFRLPLLKRSFAPTRAILNIAA